MAITHGPRICKTNPTNTCLEPLERRDLFAMSIGSDGWTDVTPSGDTHVIYVSSSGGSDANSGFSVDAPVKTIAKARSLLRDGSPDWMLLKRGDEWGEALTSWTLSGRNAQEPMVIGTYGSGDRPKLNTGTGIGFKNSDPVAHLAIMGVHFHAHTRDTDSASYSGTTTGNYGFHTMGRLDDVLVEDVVFDDYTYNLSVTGYDSTVTDFRLRRSIVTDAWSIEGKSQGMYVHKTDRILLEENLFDHNGWNGDVAAAAQNIYSHGVYMSGTNSNVVVRGNIISDSASHGLQARSGGIVENNVFLRNPINLLFGGGSTVTPGGVSGRVKGNVILDSRSINGSSRGTGLQLENIKAGANVVVSDNIFTGDTHRKASAITFGTNADATNVGDAVGINDLTIRDNIVYDWYSAWNMSPSFVPGGSGNLAVNNLQVESNDFQNAAIARLVRHGPGISGELTFADNRYDNHDSFASSGWFQIGSTTTSLTTWKSSVESSAQSVQPAYAKPIASIGGYHASIGGESSLDAFVDEAAVQMRGAYDERYSAAAVINYVRNGFAEGGVVPGGLLPLPESGGGGGSVPGGEEPPPPPPPPPADDVTPPTAPSTFRATGTSDSTVEVTWIASTDNVGVAGYEIFRDGVKIATVTGTSYTDTGLSPSTVYDYTARAFDAAGNYSGWCINNTGTTGAGSEPSPTPTVPAAPTNLTVAKRQRNKARLTWTDSATDETGFYVYTSTDGTNWTRYATVAAKAGTGSVVFNTGGFSKGRRYFRVTAFGSGGESAASNVAQFTV